MFNLWSTIKFTILLLGISVLIPCWILYHYSQQEEISSAVAHIARQLFSSAVFSFVWFFKLWSERVKWKIIIHVFTHMYVFMCGISAFMISSNDLSRGARVYILWYSLGIFFWGLIFLCAWVISSQRKCLMSHIWTWPIEEVKPHTPAYESRRFDFFFFLSLFLISVWDLLVIQATVAPLWFFVFILTLLCVYWVWCW